MVSSLVWCGCAREDLEKNQISSLPLHEVERCEKCAHAILSQNTSQLQSRITFHRTFHGHAQAPVTSLSRACTVTVLDSGVSSPGRSAGVECAVLSVN